MIRAFADTSFLLPAILLEPERRKQAAEFRAQNHGLQYVTSDGVLSEMLSRVSRLGSRPRRETAEAVRSIRAPGSPFSVVSTSDGLFERGLALYEARLDQRYSHVDCVSMAIMDELGIKHVLTFDRDFHSEGRYVVLLQRN